MALPEGTATTNITKKRSGYEELGRVASVRAIMPSYLSAALAPQLHRLQHHVHPDLVPVPKTIDKGLVRVVDADERAIELVGLDAVAESGSREPIEAGRRVFEARLPCPALERDIDGVRHLRGQLVERERRDEAEDPPRNARRDGDQVGVREWIKGREPVQPSSNELDEARVSHGVERRPLMPRRSASDMRRPPPCWRNSSISRPRARTFW